MKKIVAFGDSFVNYDWIKLKDNNWVDYLGKILNLPVVNYGVSGSGLGYAMHSFVKYYQSTEYSSDDIIIFVPTSIERLYVTSMHSPHMGSVELIEGRKNNTFEGSRPKVEKDWIDANSEHALWTVLNIYDPEINYELIKIVSFFQAWASSHLTNSVIIVRAFSQVPGNGHAEKLIKLIKPSKNFFPILEPSTSLGKISINEYATGEILRNQHMKYNNGHDYRINHLSPENRHLIATTISNVISTQSLDASYNLLNSKTNIFSNNHFNLCPTDYH